MSNVYSVLARVRVVSNILVSKQSLKKPSTGKTIPTIALPSSVLYSLSESSLLVLT